MECNQISNSANFFSQSVKFFKILILGRDIIISFDLFSFDLFTLNDIIFELYLWNGSKFEFALEKL